LLKLGIDVGETSVSKSMGRRRGPPSQTWRTFLKNHLTTTMPVDFFTVPTIRFQVLYEGTQRVGGTGAGRFLRTCLSPAFTAAPH
jgi:hypothetical protein